MNRAAIVVLNWNGIDDTIECLDSLVNQTYKNYSIIVVDNGSVDDSIERLDAYIAAATTDITLVKNARNLGFTGGVNTGIQYALKKKYDSVALFNNDATADKEWLASLVKELVDEKIGIATGLLLHADGKTIDSSGDWFSSWGLAFPRSRNQPTSTAPESGYVFGASGGASLYRTKLFKDIGLFDDSFFAYYEDADISFRSQLAGWKVKYTNKAIAYHKQGATSNRIPGFTLYQTFKNLPLVYLKNVPARLLIPIGARFYLAYWLIVANAIKKGGFAPTIKGVGMSFVLGFDALRKRFAIQRKKRVTASYIKSILWNDLPPDQTGMRKLRKLFTGKS